MTENTNKHGMTLMHFHVCVHCGSVFRREEFEGRAHTTGIHPCPKCGIEGRLNIEIRDIDASETEPRVDQ